MTTEEKKQKIKIVSLIVLCYFVKFQKLEDPKEKLNAFFLMIRWRNEMNLLRAQFTINIGKSFQPAGFSIAPSEPPTSILKNLERVSLCNPNL